MTFPDLQRDFKALTKARRSNPHRIIRAIGMFATASLRLLESAWELHEIDFKGKGKKHYRVFVAPGNKRPFSRAVNSDLFVPSADDFKVLWERFVVALEEAGRSETYRITAASSEEIDRAFYTVVIAYACAVDLCSPGNRGGPGTLFEMAIGPAVSILTNRDETGEVRIEDPGRDIEFVKTDLTFVGDTAPVLVVPTKITTRERIVQPFVHQRILDVARPNEYRSVLCVCSENNVDCPDGTTAQNRTYDVCWLKDTLVPGTIALYENYVAALSGLYYLDPPASYLDGTYRGLPPIRTFGSLLTNDLPALLSP